MKKVLIFSIFLSLFYIINTAPQQSEIILDITDPVTTTPDVHNETNKVNEENITTIMPNSSKPQTEVQTVTENRLIVKIYKIITEPLLKVFQTPKVNAVLRNIGTCLVNGAMDLFTYYLPPPFMPLIATVAGLVIPFEPVIMLQEKMPVTSYRRAFNTAMNTFMRTFDKFKMEDDFDPYMTRRFNRRFMDKDTNE